MRGTPARPTVSSRRVQVRPNQLLPARARQAGPPTNRRSARRLRPRRLAASKYSPIRLESRASSLSSSAGCAAANARSVGKSLAPLPSTRYAASVHGAPQKPSSAVLFGNAARVSFSAAMTSGAISAGSGRRRRSIAAASRIGIRDDGAGIEVELDAERRHRAHDVRKDDRRVERIALERHQRHLGRELRFAGELLEAVLLAELAVLGQIAPGLAHDPERPARHGLAANGFQQQLVVVVRHSSSARSTRRVVRLRVQR